MQCVIPLAGPQLTHPSYGLIATHPVDGQPLLRRTLETRSWWQQGRLRAQDLIFVLREGEELPALREAVTSWFPGCRVVTLPHVTEGAVLSALAGAAVISNLDQPLIVDLADILYTTALDIEETFASASIGAVVPWFEANDPCYSYLQLGADGTVIRAVEKTVISHHASAGTYIFRTVGHFLAAAGGSLLSFRDELRVGRALFVCPVMNGIIRQGLRVIPVEVGNVRSVSKLFHAAGHATSGKAG